LEYSCNYSSFCGRLFWTAGQLWTRLTRGLRSGATALYALQLMACLMVRSPVLMKYQEGLVFQAALSMVWQKRPRKRRSGTPTAVVKNRSIDFFLPRTESEPESWAVVCPGAGAAA